MKQFTPTQIDEITSRLAHRSRQLEEQVRGFSQERERAEGASEDAIADDAVAETTLHFSELRDIAAAQERMRHGNFGICTDCGEEIPYNRLSAYPTAKRCIRCQHKHERLFA